MILTLKQLLIEATGYFLNHAKIPRTVFVLKHPLLASRLDRRRVSRRQTIEAARICSRHVRNAARHNDPSVVVEVVSGVAIFVVVDIVGHASCATEHLKLFFGLNTLSAASDTTSGDTSIEEWTVVGAAVEFNLGVVDLGDFLEVVAGRVLELVSRLYGRGLT